MSKHFGEAIIEQVLEMKARGMTRKAIGETFGLTKEQIKELVKRYNRKKRNPTVPKPKGRPRKRPLTTEEEYIQRIKRLEMEVELYRSFLQAAGRM
jgi:transposase